MEVIPKILVAGVLAPETGPAIPGMTMPGRVTREKLNRIWSDLQPTYGYTQFQVSPDGSAADLIGPTSAEEGVGIKPPILQVRDIVQLTVTQSADKAETILKTIATHLGASQFLNLGVKFIYHSPAPNGDASHFVQHRMLGKGPEELADLQLGGSLWAGVKYVATAPEVVYTLVIEPLQVDPKFLYVDLDAQFPGPLDLSSVKTRIGEAERFMSHSVKNYLQRCAD